MSPFNFDYYKPDSIKEAISIFKDLDKLGLNPLYYNGGTEIITSLRLNYIETKAVIDIKGMKECNEIKVDNNKIIIGSSITLTEIEDKNIFKLLSKKSKVISDKTVRNKITLGGNLCGNINFKEMILPLMTANAKLSIASDDGVKIVDLNSNYTNKVNLNKGEFIVNCIIDESYSKFKNISIRTTKSAQIDYPLVSIASMYVEDEIRIAFSGVCKFPFRDLGVEGQLNKKYIPKEERAKRAINVIPYEILDDVQGSKEYRKFVLYNNLIEVISTYEE